jgi:hypothetical protein
MSLPSPDGAHEVYLALAYLPFTGLARKVPRHDEVNAYAWTNTWSVCSDSRGRWNRFTGTTPKLQAQAGIEVGVAPDCPYGYYDVAPYNITVPLPATMARSGSLGTDSLAPA